MAGNTRRQVIESKEERKKRLIALMDTLGVEGMIEYLNAKYGKCEGDYTAEREELLKNVTREDIQRYLRQRHPEEF